MLMFAVVGLSSRTQAAGIVTVPALAPGSQYRLIFLTAGTTAATSTTIATYNTFVTNLATGVPALPTTTWTAIGTTDSLNAITNIGANTGVPVYNLGGNLG